MDNLQQMREAFQKTYGGLGLMSEMEAALFGAWCLAWTAGAEAAQDDAEYLNKIMGDVLGEDDACQWPVESKPQDVSGWIPVSERLPDMNVSIVGKTDSDKYFVGRIENADCIITHWKPL